MPAHPQVAALGCKARRRPFSQLLSHICQGPSVVIKEYARANIKGAIFACEGMEANKKARDSFVVTLRDTTDPEGDKRCGGTSNGYRPGAAVHSARRPL